MFVCRLLSLAEHQEQVVGVGTEIFDPSPPLVGVTALLNILLELGDEDGGEDVG